METRANYVFVGAFVLAMIAGLFVFVVWIAKTQFDEVRDPYYIYFSGSVTGLQEGSVVRYRGVPVGTVTDIRLDPANVGQVRVKIEVKEDTPIKRDSIAALEQQGVTGGVYVQIYGGTERSPRLEPERGEIPVIQSRPSRFAEVVDAAPQLLNRALEAVDKLNQFLTPDNMAAIRQTIANVRDLTGELARASKQAPELMAAATTTLERTASLAGTLDTAADRIVPGLEETLAQTRRTLATLDTGVKGLTGDARAVLEGARQATEQLSAFVAENRRPVRDFTATGLSEYTQLATRLRDVATQLERLLGRLENDPASVLFGNTREGVPARGR